MQKTQKSSLKGESLATEKAIDLMIIERQHMDIEHAKLREENYKLQEELSSKKMSSVKSANQTTKVVEKVVEKIVLDPNAAKWKEEDERLRRQNEELMQASKANEKSNNVATNAEESAKLVRSILAHEAAEHPLAHENKRNVTPSNSKFWKEANNRNGNGGDFTNMEQITNDTESDDDGGSDNSGDININNTAKKYQKHDKISITKSGYNDDDEEKEESSDEDVDDEGERNIAGRSQESSSATDVPNYIKPSAATRRGRNLESDTSLHKKE